MLYRNPELEEEQKDENFDPEFIDFQDE